MTDIEHEYTDEIVCPWCGYEQSDSWEFEADEDDIECGSCGNVFSYQKEVTVSYSTQKQKCDDSGKKCEYVMKEDSPYIYNGKNWTTYKCKICDHMKVKVEFTSETKPYIIPIDK